FWKGHVAIAQSADWMIHASGLHMEVVVEPLRRALERIAESHGPVLAILRPSIELPAAAAPQKAPPAPQPPGPAQKAAPAPQPAGAAQNPAPASAPAQTPSETPVQKSPGATGQQSERKIESAAQIVAEKIHETLSAPPQERSERSGNPQKASERPVIPA